MKTVTFDWNCIISVEKSDAFSRDVLQLVEFHRSGIVDVGITTVSASESLKRSKRFPASAAQFRRRIENLGWQDLTTLLGPAVLGLSYYDMCEFVDENFENERDQIWQVLGGKTFHRVLQKIVCIPLNIKNGEMFGAMCIRFGRT